MNDREDERRVCHNCVGESYLSEVIEKTGVIARCSYCDDEEEPTITIEELADKVQGAFESHYERTSSEPDDFQSAMLRDKEIAYEWWREGEDVVDAIANAANVSDEIAKDVQKILEERHLVSASDYLGEEQEFDSNSQYEEKGPNDYQFRVEWDSVERSLKERSRFFNRDADALLARLFANVDQLADRQGQPVVVNAGTGYDIKSFYRARTFHGGDDGEIIRALKSPDKELGPPPPRFARAGRMNAQGISVFYGASDPETALAEIRPPVGSRVLVGKFDLARDVRLLDVEALRSVFIEGSIFDPNYIRHRELAQFLGRLSERMTMPVMPDDEPKEYLITQMIADFVAQVGATPIDGMLYRSVQSEGDHINVVMFNRASRVVEWEIPSNAEVDVRTYEMDEDGRSIDYSVIEWLPTKEEPKAAAPHSPFDFVKLSSFDDDIVTPDNDSRPQTLQLVPESLQVHHVTGVKITTDEYKVDRHRYQRRGID